MRKSLHCEVVKTEWLLRVPAAFNMLNKHLFDQVVVVKICPHGLSVVVLVLVVQVFKLLIVDALAVAVPLRVNVLHVAIEAAPLRQELRLVEVSLIVISVGFDAWLLLETTIRVVFCFVDCQAKQSIVLKPLFYLVFLLLFVQGGHGLEIRLVLQRIIVPLGEEENLNREQQCQQGGLVNHGRRNDVFKAVQPLYLAVFVGVALLTRPQVVLLDEVGDRDAHGDQELRSAINAHSRLRVALPDFISHSSQLGNRFIHVEDAIFEGVVQQCR